MSAIVAWREWVGSRPFLLTAGWVVLTAAIVFWLHRARAGRARPIGLVGALGTAYVAQSALALWLPLGIALYLLAIALFVAWDRAPHGQPPQRSSPSISTSILLLILTLACLTRFYDLGDTPYGLDGDEALWTAKTAFYLSTGRAIYDADWRFRYTPVSYFSENLFFKLVGPSFGAARVQVATFSVLAVVLFTLGAASLWGTRVGLVAGALLAVSIVDVAMGRVALIESQIALPMGLSVFGLGMALKRERWAAWPWFLLTGVVLGLGALTFETFYPVAGAVVLYTLICMLRPQKVGGLGLVAVLLLLIPLALLYPLMSEHLRMRRSDHNKSGQSLLEPGLSGSQVLRRAISNTGDVVYNFYEQRFADLGVSRDGPIINGALVPLLVLGLAYLLPRWRAGHHLFLLLWLGLTLFLVPILFGSPWVRVMFPAFPALYAVVALFLVNVGDEVLPGSLVPFLGVAWFVLAAVNMTIYFREFQEPAERVKRRELYDLVSQHTGEGRQLFLLNWVGMGDFVGWEERGLPLAAAANVPLTRVSWAYRLVSFGELLPLTAQADDVEQLTVIFDRTMTGPEREYEARVTMLEAWSHCYPGAEVERTPSFTVYTLDQAALSSPVCQGAFPPLLSSSWTNETPSLSWEPLPGQTALRPVCERLNDAVAVWVEAEALHHPGGWRAVWPPAASFAGGSGYLADEWAAEGARGEIYLSGARTFTVWARAYYHRLFAGPVTVRVGETALMADAPQNGWAWQRLGMVRRPAGESPTTLRLTRDYVGYPSPFLFDAFLFSRDTSFDPNVVSPWEIVLEGPTLNDAGGVYHLDQAAAWSPGHYRCRLRLLGETWVDEWGEPGVWSHYAGLWIEE